MKTLVTLLIAMGLTVGVAAAQDLAGNANNSVGGVKPGVDVNGFKAPKTLNQSSKAYTRFPDTHPNLKPQLGGILVDGTTKYGSQLVNPCAPAGYGYGAKYLTAPSSNYDLQHESGPAAHRDAGGFKLFSIEF
jgi:hypothetical protein